MAVNRGSVGNMLKPAPSSPKMRVRSSSAKDGRNAGTSSTREPVSSICGVGTPLPAGKARSR